MTVLDKRELVFDGASLRASMHSENRVARTLRLTCDPTDTIHLLPDEQCLEVTHEPMTLGGAKQAIIHRLSATQVGALLIAYCIGAGIPVPRNCKKTISIQHGHVALSFANRISLP